MNAPPTITTHISKLTLIDDEDLDVGHALKIASSFINVRIYDIGSFERGRIDSSKGVNFWDQARDKSSVLKLRVHLPHFLQQDNVQTLEVFLNASLSL